MIVLECRIGNDLSISVCLDSRQKYSECNVLFRPAHILKIQLHNCARYYNWSDARVGIRDSFCVLFA